MFEKFMVINMKSSIPLLKNTNTVLTHFIETKRKVFDIFRCQMHFFIVNIQFLHKAALSHTPCKGQHGSCTDDKASGRYYYSPMDNKEYINSRHKSPNFPLLA